MARTVKSRRGHVSSERRIVNFLRTMTLRTIAVRNDVPARQHNHRRDYNHAKGPAWGILAVPTPIKQLFDKFSLHTYEQVEMMKEEST